MKNRKLMILPMVVMLMWATIGCDENENARLAQMAEQNLQRQAEQNQRMADLQREIAAGTQLLVQADAEARKEILAVQQQLQGEQARIGQQRDVLEQERRTIALQRHRDPLIAQAIAGIGLLLACLLPLVLCWHLLREPTEPADDGLVAEVLLADLVAPDSLLLDSRPTKRRLSDKWRPPPSVLTDDSSERSVEDGQIT